MKKVLLSILIIGILSLSCIGATDVPANTIVDQNINIVNEQITNVEDAICEMAVLNIEKGQGVKDLNSGEQIVQKKEKIDLLLTDLEKPCMQKANDYEWHPGKIINKLDGYYNVYGYPVNYNGKQQYHIICEDGGKGTKLHNHVTKIIEKTSTRVNKSPEKNHINYSGDSTVISLNTTNIQKFVFVYDELNSLWRFALSTNKIIYSMTITEAVLLNNIPFNDSKNWTGQIDGRYDLAMADADRAFDHHTYVQTSMQECVIRNPSNDMDAIKFSIYAPEFLSQM